MLDRQLSDRLQEIAQRIRKLRLCRALTVGWLVVALIGALWLLVPNVSAIAGALSIPLVCGLAGLAAILAWVISERQLRDERWVARQIESRFADLDAKLLASLEQIADAEASGQSLGYLQSQVIVQSLAHDKENDWSQIVPSPLVNRWRATHWLSVTTLLAVIAALILHIGPFDSNASNPTPTPIANVPVEPPVNDMIIEPGDTEVERGSSLIVLARFTVAVPPQVTLEITDSETGQTRRLPMKPSLDDPVVAARVPAIENALTYRVVHAEGESQWHHVKIFEYPILLQADATLHYPAYTGLSEKVIADTRNVSGVEGTRLTWSCKLNKPVASATLIAKNDSDDRIVLQTNSQNTSEVIASLSMKKSKRYELELIDDAGRRNRRMPEFVVTVLPNRRPDLKLVFPRRDLRVSPIEEVQLEATAYDDFGLKAFGLTYSLAGEKPSNVTLAEDGEPNQTVKQNHLLAFESLDAQPDQLVSYHFWAEDIGPDGKVRRTFSDMYFAEVRHFDEIFREGQQPPKNQQQQQQQQQQGPNAKPIEEAVKSQREIINATWNLIRRETSSEPTPQFVEDVKVIAEAQTAALEKVRELKEKVTDAKSKGYVEAVEKYMANAFESLSQAVDTNSPPTLAEALTHEQSAYQALLKLKAREHEVTRQQMASSKSSQQKQNQNSRSQQQLQQLKLDSKENRYESEKTAQQQKDDPAKREVKQVLNRLRELARRQSDLKDKLKELELALQAAKDEQEKEALERELKRLRKQQRDMLRDLDELRNRMDKPENQQQMADAKQQVDETRENVRRASEALEKGMTSKALADATRAERKLEELRDDFRKKSAGQFTEEVKEMRDDARKLAKDQGELKKKLDELDEQKGRSLRDKGERKQVAEGFQQQKQKLDRLMENMRKTSEESESAEPLLSKQLYDTLRKADQQRVDQALDVASQLLDRGFNQEAKEIEPKARQGVDDLKRGIEKAADSVLGDEVESLRRAKDSLKQLADDVRNEANQKDPGNRQLAQAGDPRSQAQPQPNQQGKQSSPQRPGNQDGKQPNGKQQDGKQGDGKQANGKQAGDQPGKQDSNAQRSANKGGDAKQNDGKPGDGKQGDAKQADGKQLGKQGNQPGQRPGKQQANGKQPGKQSGQSDSKQPGQQDGKQANSQNPGNGKQPSNAPGKQGQPGQSPPSNQQANSQQPGQQPGQQPSQQPSNSQQQGNGKQDGKQPGQQQANSQSNQRDPLNFLNQQSRTGSGNSGPHGPITGEDFREWSDRLRDVEEMVSDPKLREKVARVRDRAREMRIDFKRHSKQPNWDLVRKLVAEPLVELQQELADELARKDDSKELTPIDRDPVPGEFSDLVRRYYEKLGTGD